MVTCIRFQAAVEIMFEQLGVWQSDLDVSEGKDQVMSLLFPQSSFGTWSRVCLCRKAEDGRCVIFCSTLIWSGVRCLHLYLNSLETTCAPYILRQNLFAAELFNMQQAQSKSQSLLIYSALMFDSSITWFRCRFGKNGCHDYHGAYHYGTTSISGSVSVTLRASCLGRSSSK